MSRRVALTGYDEADLELSCAILKMNYETRIMLWHLQEIRKGIKSAARWESTATLENFLMDFLNQGMAGALQRMTRQVNVSRKAVLNFLEKNKAS